MGCDIHLYAEIQASDGSWRALGAEEPNPEYLEWPDEEEPTRWIPSHVSTYRNYDLFGVLAGVRFREHAPIDGPRGLPDDVSARVRQESDSWNGDGHSHSWLTVEEVLAYDWSKPAACGRDLRNYCSDFLEGIEALAKLGPPAKTRIVFWFDN